MIYDLRINPQRLRRRILQLAEIGGDPNGGVTRLALSDADKQARDLVISWMRDLGLEVTIDEIGNIYGLRRGITKGQPIMTGSHIDSVKCGGRYDGSLGVIAGLEIVETLNTHNVRTTLPICISVFTNEEGVRYAPDMMGSAVFQGHLPLARALRTRGTDGSLLGEELNRIDYSGNRIGPELHPAAFLELHIEQGPLLEQMHVTIGSVQAVTGISWHRHCIYGQANHAGTTPMSMRTDAGFAASMIAVETRRVAQQIGGDQVATVGKAELYPNETSVIAGRAIVTTDLRNSDEQALSESEKMLSRRILALAEREGVEIHSDSLARTEPVQFDLNIVELIENIAKHLSFSTVRMNSGAGHDAQMFAPNCPTGMIFVPSYRGISHSAEEHTAQPDLEAGVNVLLHSLMQLSESDLMINRIQEGEEWQ